MMAGTGLEEEASAPSAAPLQAPPSRCATYTRTASNSVCGTHEAASAAENWSGHSGTSTAASCNSAVSVGVVPAGSEEDAAKSDAGSHTADAATPS
ncbi:hypothetical protein EON68_01250 [archaeon]|nr:MAG: hypothetical protein EON68_01250 [archaeon]